MKKRRIFIAINIPADLKRRLAILRQKWPGLPARWTSGDNLHLTLVFIGYVSDDQLAEICKITKEVAKKYSPFELKFSRVVYGPAFNQAAFANYVRANGLTEGRIHDVNSAESTWNQRWDLRFQQELPGIWGVSNFVGDNRFKLVLDIENFANLLNDEWGTFYNAPANGQLPIVRADIVRRSDVNNLGVAAAPALNNDLARTNCLAEGDCVYRYNSFSPLASSLRSNSLSTWRARIGIRYEF